MVNLQYRRPKGSTVLKAVLYDALSVANKVFVDKLNCKESFRRQATDDYTAEELIELICDDSKPKRFTHFAFIYRDQRHMNHGRIASGLDPLPNYWDVGFSVQETSADAEYFVFAEVGEIKGFGLANRHKLEIFR